MTAGKKEIKFTHNGNPDNAGTWSVTRISNDSEPFRRVSIRTRSYRLRKLLEDRDSIGHERCETFRSFVYTFLKNNGDFMEAVSEEFPEQAEYMRQYKLDVPDKKAKFTND